MLILGTCLWFYRISIASHQDWRYGWDRGAADRRRGATRRILNWFKNIFFSDLVSLLNHIKYIYISKNILIRWILYKWIPEIRMCEQLPGRRKKYIFGFLPIQLVGCNGSSFFCIIPGISWKIAENFGDNFLGFFVILEVSVPASKFSLGRGVVRRPGSPENVRGHGPMRTIRMKIRMNLRMIKDEGMRIKDEIK